MPRSCTWGVCTSPGIHKVPHYMISGAPSGPLPRNTMPSIWPILLPRHLWRNRDHILTTDGFTNVYVLHRTRSARTFTLELTQTYPQADDSWPMSHALRRSQSSKIASAWGVTHLTGDKSGSHAHSRRVEAPRRLAQGPEASAGSRPGSVT